MSLEIIVVCDRCGMVMAGRSARTTPHPGAEARRDARESPLKAKTSRPGGKDFCGDCWPEHIAAVWDVYLATKPITEESTQDA